MASNGSPREDDGQTTPPDHDISLMAASIDALPVRRTAMIDVGGGLVSGNGHGLLLGGGERVVGVGGGSAVSSVVAGVRNASGQGRPIPHARANSKTDFLDLADSTTRLGTSPSDINSRLEQKRIEHERQRALTKKAFEDQMKALEAQQEQEERELLEKHTKTGPAASAPASPPRSELSDNSTSQANQGGAAGGGAAPVRSRSGNDLASFGGRGGAARLGSSTGSRTDGGYSGVTTQSVPGSRRQSGEHDDSTLGFENLAIGNRGAQTLKPNGQLVPNEKPVLKSNGSGEAPLLTSFLFDDELDAELQSSAYGGKYLQMNTDDDKFPILVRRDSYPGILSASSAALDLAPLSQTPPRHGFRLHEANRTSEWPRFSQTSGAGDSAQPGVSAKASPADRLRSVTHGHPNGAHESSADLSPSTSRAQALPPPASHSGRNSPVVEISPAKGNGGGGGGNGGLAPGGGASEDLKRQQGFAPRPPLVNRHSIADVESLSNSAFGSGAFSTDSAFLNDRRVGSSAFSNAYPGLDQLGGLGGSGAFGYDGTGPYGGLGSLGPKSNGSSFLVKPKREPEISRFAGLRLEDLQGDMFALCKDQHGCRFLQKKLEDGNPEHRDMIFNEIFPHFAELMTDPFGNYLSQKLLEYSSDEQRDALIESISGDLVQVSLNMHGTRAVQKMIDFLSTQRQVQALIMALNLNVVTLIKDLNGNHVIQKCLNHLPPEDNQFIFNSVAANCIEVATHRHGCCVLQRCIDHASESQRIQLVTEITYNSLTLVQDPFGNYVVQYVLDLNDNRFIEAIVRQFIGNVCALSASKFSSNVVEKCIRVSDSVGRKAIVDEILDRSRLERLLRDSFANYVVQTALDYAEPLQRAQLVEAIRPILPMIRNTPYGKRIQSKIQRESMNDPLSRGGGGYHPGLFHAGAGHYLNQFAALNQFASHTPPPGALHSHISAADAYAAARASPYLTAPGGSQAHAAAAAHLAHVAGANHNNAALLSGLHGFESNGRYGHPQASVGGLSNGMDYPTTYPPFM